MHQNLFYLKFFLSTFWVTSNAAKNNSLSMLALMTLTGGEPSISSACRVGMEIAIEAANSLPNILPEYQLELVFADEGPNGDNAAKSVLLFYQDFRGGPVTLSPVFLGPQLTGGCLAVGSTAQFANAVEIAIKCSLIPTSNRVSFPNVYRTMVPREYELYGLMALCKHFHWTTLMVLTSHDPTIMSQTAMLLDMALSHNIMIPYVETFDSDGYVSTDVIIQSVVANRLRIIVILPDTMTSLYGILCRLYDAGIVGPKYAFLLPSSQFGYLDFDLTSTTNSHNWPPRCTVDMVVVQIARILAVVARPLSQNLTVQSSLGLSANDFEAEYSRRTNSQQLLDATSRQHCFDVATQAVLTLNSAEIQLQNDSLTLANYSKVPDQILRIVNNSAGQTSFTGLVNGPQKYSSRLELDYIPQFVVQPTKANPSSFNYVFAIQNDHIDRGDFGNLLVSEFTLISTGVPLVFGTENGQAPSDRPSVVIVNDNVPDELFYTVVVLASILGVAQVVSAILVIVQHFFNLWEDFPRKKYPVSNLMILTCFLGFGAVASPMFVRQTSDAICWLSRVILSLFLPLTSATINNILINYRTATVNSKQLKQYRDIMVVPQALKWIFIAVAILIPWFVTEPMTFVTDIDSPIYEPILDVYIERHRGVCQQAGAGLGFEVAITIIPLFFMSMGALYSFVIQHNQTAEIRVGLSWPDMNRLRMASMNLFVCDSAIVLIVVLMSSQGSKDQDIVVSIGCLFAAAMTWTITFGSIFKAIFCQFSKRQRTTQISIPE